MWLLAISNAFPLDPSVVPPRAVIREGQVWIIGHRHLALNTGYVRPEALVLGEYFFIAPSHRQAKQMLGSEG